MNFTRREFVGRGLRLGGGSLVLACAARGIAAGDEDRKPRWQIGCYTRPWDKYDYRVAFDAIAEAGFKYVGLMTTNSRTKLVVSVETTVEEASEVGKEAKQRGLSIASVYGGGIPVAESLEAGIAGLKRLIDNCAACNGKNLLMGGVGDKGLYDVYYKAIAECCDYAAQKGIGISIKPHGGLNATGEQCRRTVEMVDHGNFGVWYDPGNIYYYSDAKLDPVDDVSSVDGLVVGMSVKDYIHPKDVLVTPGKGMVDFAGVFDLLCKGGFRGGALIVECLKPGSREELLAEAKEARRFLEELVDASAKPAGRRKRKQGLKAGIGVVDITPPVGYRMSGYFSERLSTGVMNPLHAKGIVLEQGGKKAVMVFCDIIGLSKEVTSQARQAASKQTGIPPESMIISATHTHTGPLYWGALRDHFHDRAVAEFGNDPCEEIDYAGFLADKIVEVICLAAADVREVIIKAATTIQHGLSFNRRFHMQDGEVRFNPGVLNPNIVRAAGPVDPEVGLVFLCDAGSGAMKGGIINFALHLDTVQGTLYAADYPFYVERELRNKYGEDFVLFFGTGTCGDINHIDVTRRERLTAEEIGTTLGMTAANRVDNLKASDKVCLGMASETVEADLQRFTDEETAWARENISKVGTKELSFIDQVRAYKILAVQSLKSKTIEVEVQAIRLGNDAAIVGLPGEIFVELGLEIKRRSPFAVTLVIELCQDAPGYIPTKKAFAEGSYETVNSRITRGGGEKIVEAAVGLLKGLWDGRASA